MEEATETREKCLQHKDNKKTIRHEDFVAGISKGMAILDSFGTDRHRLNITMAAERRHDPCRSTTPFTHP